LPPVCAKMGSGLLWLSTGLTPRAYSWHAESVRESRQAENQRTKYRPVSSPSIDCSVTYQPSSQNPQSQRDPESARDFIEDLAGRLSNRIQLTSDGLKMYVKAVDKAFAGDVDYAMLIKVYGIAEGAERRYSPAVCIGCESHAVTATLIQGTSTPATSSATTSACA
jgi:hypothetical protein